MIDDEEDTLDDTIHPDEDVEDDPSLEEEVEGEESEDVDSDEDLDSIFDPDGAEAKRLARRPDISALEDAFEPGIDGTPIPKFKVGSRIIMERFSIFLSQRQWLNTNTYFVESIDYETGVIRLWNPELSQYELTSWKTAIAKHGFVYKLPPAKGGIIKKRGRGRPSKMQVTPPPATAAATTPIPDDGKPRRGRPKGSKNRAKD